MEKEKTSAILLTQDQNGQVNRREITQEELGRIFFQEGNHEWDLICRALPAPVWEKLYGDDGTLIYEGFTLEHKAFGAGRAFFKDGTVSMEGIFGIKGFQCGKVFSPNGLVQFEGMLRLNHGYGPNYPEYGSWYDENGKMAYHGKFRVMRSSLGWPKVVEPEVFGSIPGRARLKQIIFSWEDARRLMQLRQEDQEDLEQPPGGADPC